MAEAHQDRDILRGYELRLLRCTLSPPPPAQPEPPAPPASASENDNNNLHARIEQLLGLIESGKYLQVISSDVAAELLVDCSQLVDRVEFFVGANGVDVGEEERACRVIIVLCVAVAALFFFTQCNITGPLDELPNCPLPFKVSEGEADLEAWARNQLIADGSDLLAKFSYVQYIVFAKMLVMRTKDLLFEGSISPVHGIRSVSWWLARILLIEQRILDELSSSLLDLLRVCMAESLHHFGNLEQVAGYWGAMLHDEEASAIVSMVHLEAGIMDYTYAHVDSCRLHFESAEAAAGLELSVTGVLGYRTMHQVEPRAQRVLVTNNSSSSNSYSGSSISPTLQTSGSSVVEDNLQQHQHQISGDSDIFMRPILLKNGSEYGLRSETSQNGAPDGVAPLKAIQQAVILAKCLLLEKSSRHDELQRWDMAPFIEAIDSQPSSFFALQCFRNLLRIRWESTRSRTKERAVEMMNKLVEGAQKPFPGVTERIPFCYVAHVPTIPALQKEYSELLVSCGLIGEALRIFEGLELWDNVIYCNRLLGKKAAAVELIKKRLSEVPNDPKLWCSLGDVTNDDSCYKKALEVSNDKSIRAKRSLARSAYNKGDYETSKVLWESAMGLNSLYPDGWFALGAAALKARDIEKALYAFTNAVQLDPENGEAWNNIACLHMIKKRSQEAFISFKEALKLKRDSWQMWENFGSVAMDVGNMHQALEAVQMVLNLTSGKRVDAELLERIMVEIEQRASSCLGDSCNDSVGNFEIRPELSRETEQLVELLGKILQQIVKSESRADIWGLYGRWHKVKGDLIMCSEAFLKQVRLYQGSNLWKDRERFKKFAKASVDLCKVYVEISSSTGSSRELFTAEMHLKNILKQGDSFSDTQEFRDIQACLDEVRLRLPSESVPT